MCVVMDKLKICYINHVGKNTDGMNVYQFMFTETPDDVFCDGWSEKPACNISNDVLMPDESMYNYIAELKTDMPLDLAQDNCCYSMQDCRDGIIALASENLDTAEEYPEEGRVVIHFGDEFDEIEDMLANRELRLKFI